MINEIERKNIEEAIELIDEVKNTPLVRDSNLRLKLSHASELLEECLH